MDPSFIGVFTGLGSPLNRFGLDGFIQFTDRLVTVSIVRSVDEPISRMADVDVLMPHGEADVTMNAGKIVKLFEHPEQRRRVPA